MSEMSVIAVEAALIDAKRRSVELFSQLRLVESQMAQLQTQRQAIETERVTVDGEIRFAEKLLKGSDGN